MSRKNWLIITLLAIVVAFYGGYQYGTMQPQTNDAVDTMEAQKTASENNSKDLADFVQGRWIKYEDTGNWYMGYPDPDSVRFFPDGTLTMESDDGGQLTADYVLIDSNHLRINIYGGLDSVVFEVSTTGGDLILKGSDPFGVKKYRRNE